MLWSEKPLPNFHMGREFTNETRQQYTSKTTVNKHNALKLTLSWTM